MIQALLLVSLVVFCQAEIKEDEVTSLPGLDKQPTFKHYSGFLKATGTKKLHYWFVEAQQSPKTAPVVLWLNGGPGCSSLDGMLTEHGPFRVDETGKTLTMNPHSWNQIANMLYMEAPAGVGFSYSDDKNYTTTDDEVSLNNFWALRYFFMRYSEYSSNEFFITGESYGGIYVPTLAVRVAQDKHFNFKGFAVGNGMSDYVLNDNSIIYFAYFHGLFGTGTWVKLVEGCCINGDTRKCNFASQSPACTSAVSEASTRIGSLNVYNMYAECYKGPSIDEQNRPVFHSSHIMFQGSAVIKTQAKKLKETAKVQEIGLTPPCIDARGITNYLNNPDVRKALHIPTDLPRWDICSGVVGSLYQRLYNNMTSQYKEILQTGKYRVLVYNGDIDMACNFLMDEWFTDSLGQTVIDESRPWMYTAEDGSQQVGGFAKQFKDLLFTTVRGAGHMVPTDRPIPALKVFEYFIQGKSLL